jgi:hypothetical protein
VGYETRESKDTGLKKNNKKKQKLLHAKLNGNLGGKREKSRIRYKN